MTVQKCLPQLVHQNLMEFWGDLSQIYLLPLHGEFHGSRAVWSHLSLKGQDTKGVLKKRGLFLPLHTQSPVLLLCDRK